MKKELKETIEVIKSLTLEIENTYENFFGKKSRLADALNDTFCDFGCYICNGDTFLGEEEKEFLEDMADSKLTTDKIRERSKRFENKINSENFIEMLVGVSEVIKLDRKNQGEKIGDSTDVTFSNSLIQMFEIIGAISIDLNHDDFEREAKRYDEIIQKIRCDINDILIGKEKTAHVHKNKDLQNDKMTENSDLLNSLFEELENLVGMEYIKKEIYSMVNLLKIKSMRTSAGLLSPEMSLHMVFTGNPGTGKTTIARLIAKIYKAIGVLKTGQLIEVDRSGLVAGYVGHTETKTMDAIDSARGGILFIDEAYALYKEDGRDFGSEAIVVLLKAMEDRRNEFIVVAAGYDRPMEAFLLSNPGLKSRFSKHIHFPDYSPKELTLILKHLLEKYDYNQSEELDNYFLEGFERLCANKDENFANARVARNIFEEAIMKQANRLSEKGQISQEELRTFVKQDFTFVI